MRTQQRTRNPLSTWVSRKFRWILKKGVTSPIWIISHQTTVSAQNSAGENEPNGVVVNYYLREQSVGDVAVQIFKGARLISEYVGSGEPSLNSIEWGMTERIARTPEEIARWDRRNRPGGEAASYSPTCFTSSQ